MDEKWADRICSRKLKRDGQIPAGYKQQLIDNVLAHANSSKPSEREQSIRRLIRLQQKKDNQEETEWKWLQKGIIVTADHHQTSKIASVKLDFTSEEWVDLLNTEGELLPTCCAKTSRIRDILTKALKKACLIHPEELTEAAHLIKDHGYDQYSPEHPLSRLVSLYDLLQNSFRTGRGWFHSSFNLDDPHECITALALYCNNYEEFSFSINTTSSKEMKFQDHCNQQKALIDLHPVVVALYKHIKELNSTYSGYGIIDNKKGIAYSRSGLAIYMNEQLAQEICNRLNKQEHASRKKESLRKKYQVVPMAISLEHGIEIR